MTTADKNQKNLHTLLDKPCVIVWIPLTMNFSGENADITALKLTIPYIFHLSAFNASSANVAFTVSTYVYHTISLLYLFLWVSIFFKVSAFKVSFRDFNPGNHLLFFLVLINNIRQPHSLVVSTL
jgi:hypothetical protein